METFGWYRLTGFLHKNILPAKVPETTVYGQWFFLSRIWGFFLDFADG